MDAIAQVTNDWSIRLADARVGDVDLGAAGRVRDELHAVANRVLRIVARPGRAVVAVIDATSSLSMIADVHHLLALLRMEAVRLADVCRRLTDAEWAATGIVGGSTMCIEDLVVDVLHRSGSRLRGSQECP